MFLPNIMFYMITNMCNEKCSKCSHWKKADSPTRIPVEKIVHSVRNCNSISDFCIVGGEPLLFKDEIIQIAQGISGFNKRIVLVTNGTLCSTQFLKAISTCNIHLVFSIDTFDREFWKFVRGHDTYNLVLMNLNIAIDILGSQNISVQSVLALETEKYISAVKRFAESKNLFHSVQPYVQYGFDGTWQHPEKVLDLSDPHENCYANKNNLSVMQNGDVYVCFQQSLITNCSNPIGNLNEMELDVMMKSDYLQKVICTQ